MLAMRELIVTKSWSHLARNWLSPRMAAAIRAPNAGGLEMCARVICASLDSTALAELEDLVTMDT